MTAIGARCARPLLYKTRVILLRKWFGSKESVAEKQLLHRYRGDRARLERMIELELMHRPGLSRAAGAQAALDRWLHDERPERWARGSSAVLEEITP